MVRSRTALIVLAVAAVAALAAVNRSTPDTPPPSRADLQAPPEPPLPSGAVCRLGTVLFQGGGQEVSYSSDGRSLFAAGPDGMRELDAATGRTLHEYRPPEHSGAIRAYLITPDRRTLLETERPDFVTELGAPDTRLRVRDWPSGKLRHEFPPAVGGQLAVSVAGTLAVLAGGSEVQVFDLAAGRHVRMELPGGHIVWAGFRPGTTELLLVDWAAEDVTLRRARLRRWDFRPGEAVELPGFPIDACAEDRLAVSPDGRRLVVATSQLAWVQPDPKLYDLTRDLELQVWDLATGERTGVADLARQAQARTLFTNVLYPGSDIQPMFLADGSLVTVGTWRGNHAEGLVACIRDGRTGRPFTSWTAPGGKPGPVAGSPDGRTLAVGTVSGFVRRFDTATGLPLPPTVTNDGAVTDISFLDAETVVTWADKPLYWSPRTGRPRAVKPDDLPIWANDEVNGLSQAHRPGVVRSDWYIAIRSSSDPGLRYVGVRPRFADSPLWRTRIDGANVYPLTFSADGNTLYLNESGAFVARASQTGKELFRWDLVALGVVREIGLGGYRAWASPDGRHLAVRDHPQGLAVIDAATGALRRRLDPIAATPVAFSADGRLVAAVIGPGTVRVWDVATGAVRRTVRPDHPTVTALAFDPTGTRLVTGGSEGTGLVWGSSILEPP